MDINYKFIGWCHEDKHDKVWGVIDLGQAEKPDEWGMGGWTNKYITFWGRRGKKLQTKVSVQHHYDVEKLIDKKRDKGYTRVDRSRLDTVYPEFQDDLEKTAVWALLSG
jgi:hypothetical protein